MSKMGQTDTCIVSISPHPCHLGGLGLVGSTYLCTPLSLPLMYITNFIHCRWDERMQTTLPRTYSTVSHNADRHLSASHLFRVTWASIRGGVGQCMYVHHNCRGTCNHSFRFSPDSAPHCLTHRCPGGGLQNKPRHIWNVIHTKEQNLELWLKTFVH